MRATRSYESLSKVWRCTTISNLMINEQIRDKEVRLIGSDGEQLGIMSAKEAMFKAQAAGLDLVKLPLRQNHRYARSLIMVNTVMSLREKRKKQRKSRRPSMSKKCDFHRTLIPMTLIRKSTPPESFFPRVTE